MVSRTSLVPSELVRVLEERPISSNPSLDRSLEEERVLDVPVDLRRETISNPRSPSISSSPAPEPAPPFKLNPSRSVDRVTVRE